MSACILHAREESGKLTIKRAQLICRRCRKGRRNEGRNEADSKFIAASEASLQLANAGRGTAGQDINYLP